MQRRSLIIICFLSAIVAVSSAAAHAEIKTIEADSVYIMGDNDSKVDARRIATQEAKRKALDLAGTYIASLTQVKEYKLTKDEVTAYTAGIIETEIIADETKGTIQHPEIYIKARCKIDADGLKEQIDRYRDNEDLREQLEASAKESDKLRKERDDLMKQLAAEKDKAKAEETRKRLDTVLTNEEVIDDANRMWAGLSPKLDIYEGRNGNHVLSRAEMDKASALLERAVRINPKDQRSRILLASLYQRKSNPAAAENELRAAIAAQPSKPMLHMQLGALLRDVGRYNEALQEFRLIEKKRPNEPYMLFLTGTTHKAAGNCRLAVAYLKRFLKFTQRNDKPHIIRMKNKAKEAIFACGDRPKGRRVNHLPPRPGHK